MRTNLMRLFCVGMLCISMCGCATSTHKIEGIEVGKSESVVETSKTEMHKAELEKKNSETEIEIMHKPSAELPLKEQPIRHILYANVVAENEDLVAIHKTILGEDLEIVKPLPLGWLCTYVGTDLEFQGCTFELVSEKPIELPRKVVATTENIFMRSKIDNIFKVSDTEYRVMLKSHISVEKKN